MLPYPPYNSPDFPAFLIALIGLLVVVVGVAVVFIPYWFIFKKAGFSPWLAILMLLPLANIVLLYILAFSPWKVVPVSEGVPRASPPGNPAPSFPAGPGQA